MTTYYPNFFEDPHTGLVGGWEGRVGRVHCKKCIKYGEIIQPVPDGPTPVSRQLFSDDNLDLCQIAKPCTICAIANGGWWGWEGCHPETARRWTLTEPEKKETGGVLPGCDGITDVLSEHGTPDDWEREAVSQLAHDYQVILGFVQYAHYNHLKWTDIIEPSGEVDMDEYKSDTIEEVKHHWYWWKLIPENLVLPERYKAILVQMLVNYKPVRAISAETSEGCVPKTMQRKPGPLTGDIWPDFWNTFVEPSQVAWIFRETMRRTLLKHKAKLEVGDGTSEILKKEIIDFTTLYFKQTEEQAMRQVIDTERDVQNVLDTFIGSTHDDRSEFFFYKERGGGVGDFRHLKIKDRDIFGGYLHDLVDCNHPDFGYGWLQKPQSWAVFPARGTRCQKEFWNLHEEVDFQKLFDNVYKVIGFEDTSYWEDVQRVMDERVVSDYTDELYYRQYLEEDGEAWSDNPETYEDVAYLGEYEVEDGEVNSTQGTNAVNSEKIIEKLKEMQTMVDDNVKEAVPEGVYLDLVNKMCDMYKLIKDIPEI